MNNRRILAAGGLQRDNAELLSSVSGQHYYKARLSVIDWRSKEERVLLDYTSPKGACPDNEPGIRFTAMTLNGSMLYLCTGTEVFLYRFPEMERVNYFTHPHFHDIHHVAPVRDSVAVASSGLDMVIFLNKDTLEPEKYVNVSSRDLWYKFDPSTDYRKVHTTQPHESHPNFILEMDGRAWVGRCYKNDILCLDEPGKTVRISDHRIHDGIVRGDFAYFTTVNGTITMLNIRTLKVEEVFDLNEIEKEKLPMGWCRGLFLDGDTAYVGFTTLRETQWKENVAGFVDESGRGYKRILPSRIAAYDLRKKSKIDEYVFPVDSLGAIFNMAAF